MLRVCLDVLPLFRDIKFKVRKNAVTKTLAGLFVTPAAKLVTVPFDTPHPLPHTPLFKFIPYCNGA